MDDGIIRFSMSGEPRGKGRPRVFVQGGRSIATTDPKTRAYESSVTDLARRAMRGRSPFDGPLSVSIRFRMPIPASSSKRERLAMASGETPHTGRPDVDNMTKAILDGMGEDADLKALNKRRGLDRDARVVFHNDSQIVRLFVEKLYATNPGVDVRVECLAPQARPAISPLAAAPTEMLPLFESPTGQGVVPRPAVEAELAAQ